MKRTGTATQGSGTWISASLLLRMMPVVLPHELIYALHSKGCLQSLSPEAELHEYWEHFRNQAAANPEVGWPLTAPAGEAVALGVHGDDCRFTDQGEKIIVVTCNLIMDRSQTRFPLMVIRFASWCQCRCSLFIGVQVPKDIAHTSKNI